MGIILSVKTSRTRWTIVNGGHQGLLFNRSGTVVIISILTVNHDGSVSRALATGWFTGSRAHTHRLFLFLLSSNPVKQHLLSQLGARQSELFVQRCYAESVVGLKQAHSYTPLLTGLAAWILLFPWPLGKHWWSAALHGDINFWRKEAIGQKSQRTTTKGKEHTNTRGEYGWTWESHSMEPLSPLLALHPLAFSRLARWAVQPWCIVLNCIAFFLDIV